MRSTTVSELCDAMEFGMVIRSHGDGTFEVYGTQTEQGIGAESYIYVDLDPDGSAPEPSLTGSGYGDGWDFLRGFTGQYSYNGAVMHESEYIGGRLADYILTTPGLYVAVIIDGYPETEDGESIPVGWAVLRYDREDV